MEKVINMPSGYTAAIANDISFKEFVMNCARAFGACIELRDSPNKEIPERFYPSDYHLKEIERITKDIEELEALSEAELTKRCEEEYIESEKSRLDTIEKKNLLLEKYNKMLNKVHSWNVSSEYDGLKNFMIKQIEESIHWDCDVSYYSTPKEKIECYTWYTEKKDTLTRMIEYHEKEYEEEVKRVEERNQWIKGLRNSLESIKN